MEPTGLRALALSIVTILAGSACALVEPEYVFVDSIAAPASGPQETYFLFSGRPGLSHDDLQFRRYAGYADEALQKAGYVKASAPDEADIVVGFSYGVSAERDGT